MFRNLLFFVLTCFPLIFVIRSTKGKHGRSGSVFTKSPAILNGSTVATTLRSLIAKNSRGDVASDKRVKSQTHSQTRFYPDSLLAMEKSSNQTIEPHKSTSVSSLSQSFSIGDANRNYNGSSDLIPLAETVVTQRPQRPESARRPTSGSSLRALSQSHSNVQEMRRGPSCSSIDSSVSFETISMNPDALSESRSMSRVDTSYPLKKPPPLPAKSGRVTHTDLTNNDLSPRVSLTCKPLPATPPPDYKPKPQPRTSKLTEDDVYKNVNNVRRKV